MASIIDTLMVVFKVDTRGLKSGIKEADIDLDKVKKSLKGVSEESEKVTQETDKSGKGIEKAGKSAKESQKGFKEFGGSIKELRSSFLSLRSVLTLGLGGLGLLKLNNANVAIGNLSQLTGQGVGNIKALQNQFEKAGFSAQDADAAIKGFSNALGAAKYKGDPSGLVLPSILGVGVTDKNGKLRDAADILIDMGEAARKLTGSEQEAAIMMEQYGVSAAAAYIATRNNARELYEQEKKNSALTEEQVRNSKILNEKLVEVKKSFESIGQEALLVTSPAIKDLAETIGMIGTAARENPEAAQLFIKGIGIAALAAQGPVGMLAAGVLALFEIFKKAKADLEEGDPVKSNMVSGEWETGSDGVNPLFGQTTDAKAHRGPGGKFAGQKTWFDDVRAFFGGDDSSNSRDSGVLNEREKAFSDVVHKAESNIAGSSGGYNAVHLGKRHNNKSAVRDLKNMTLREVLERQERKEFNAAGRYQVIPSTLKGAIKALRLPLDTKFDERTQDMVFKHLANSVASDYLTGKSNDLTKALVGFSPIWAGLPSPQKGGRSYHDGVQGNRATITQAQVYEMMKHNAGTTTSTTTITNHNNIQVVSPQEAAEVVNKLPEMAKRRVSSAIQT